MLSIILHHTTGVGVGLVVLAMMIAIPGVVIPLTMLCHRIRTSRKLRMKM